jgi:hypothetical protein
VCHCLRWLVLGPRGVSFRYKDYRAAPGSTGAPKIKTMTLAPDAFLQRFLLHVLPTGFHRIRHYGLLARAARRGVLDHVRQLIAAASKHPTSTPSDEPETPQPAPDAKPPCPYCGGRMRVIEVFTRGQPLPGRIWMDSS